MRSITRTSQRDHRLAAIGGGLLLALLTAWWLGANPSPARGQVRMQIDGKQAPAASSRSHAAKLVERQGPIVQRSGTLDFDRDAGWTLGRQRLLVSRKTVLVPASDDHASSSNPKNLKGRRVMIFGRNTGSGFDALLIVVGHGVSGLERASSYKHAVSNPNWFIPSEVNPAVGETTEQVPR